MINKKRAITQMKEYGDFIVDMVNGRSIAATIDFTTPYIRRIRRYKRFQFKGNILVFNWTDNEFEALPINTIRFISPMSKILNNIRDNDVK